MGTKNKHKKNSKQKETNVEEETKPTTNVSDTAMADAAGPNDTNTTEQVDDGDQKKSYRKRKKHYYNAIRAQMEFYFGDANLSKDRFLKQLLDKDPCKF